VKELLKYLTISILSLVSLALFILLFHFEEVLEIAFSNEKIKSIKINEYSNNNKLISDLQKAVVDIEKDLDVEAKESKKYLSEIEDYEQSKNILPPAPSEIVFNNQRYSDDPTNNFSNPKPISSTQTPRLVIIIDDIISQTQVDTLNSLNLDLTLSFLPPTNQHPNSATIAKSQPSHMVHLPLEAMSFFKKEGVILKTTSTKNEIDSRIRTLRDYYPNVKYINNHTGSKFTADYNAMIKLISTLNKYNFHFLDSRTTKHTKANVVADRLGITIFSRDVFLDNKLEIPYIQKQIKLAVKKAKQKGYAIAIGHPHPVTIEALRLSQKDKLFSGVKIVFMEKLI
jgi:polysaccharide deacetylase 2 family uncharacterized protein YibQ